VLFFSFLAFFVCFLPCRCYCHHDERDEEATDELLKMKCLSVLLYGLESCPLNKAQIRSLDFAISSAFSTKSHDLIDNYYKTLYADNLSGRNKNFLCKYCNILSLIMLLIFCKLPTMQLMSVLSCCANSLMYTRVN